MVCFCEHWGEPFECIMKQQSSSHLWGGGGLNDSASVSCKLIMD
jgi:hypothetical protein